MIFSKYYLYFYQEANIWPLCRSLPTPSPSRQMRERANSDLFQILSIFLSGSKNWAIVPFPPHPISTPSNSNTHKFKLTRTILMGITAYYSLRNKKKYLGIILKSPTYLNLKSLTLLHSERPKLYKVLAVLSAIGFNDIY